MTRITLSVGVLSVALLASAAAAQTPTVQDRPFVFSISTVPGDSPRASVQVETGVGERAFDVTDSDRPEQRFGIQASFGNRLTLLGRVRLSSDSRDVRSSQQGELLYDIVQAPAAHGGVALGLGLRHESAGVNVLLGRVAAGRQLSAWRVDGNALFEKPFATGRDKVDVITSLGVSRRLVSAFHAGIEVIGEDLEGFWEEEEAEGGARLMVGPSIRITPPAGRWQVSVAGGPIIHATQSRRLSDATRGLPSSRGSAGYAVRVAFSYGF
jgi:hypothetical protein